jgi:protein disulfide-isomerase
MKKSLRFALLVCSLAFALAARAAEWTEDYAAALAQAKREHKNLLLDFTGSDWCGWCKKIDTDVFAQPAFVAYANKNLVLVKLDFPRQRPMPDAVKQQNQSLKGKYNVGGFPTLILLDASETKLFEQVGYRPGGPEAFLAALAKGGTVE